ncbi:MAG: polyketide cyclase [Chloroflexi bacterium]|nr:MAG: polyketide cyclase [Chloroflexota bacterium]
MGKTQISAPAGVPFIDIEREFKAPPDLLYRAYSEPDLVKQWLGPRKYEMVIEKWDLRDGGSYRYIHRDDAGNAFGFHGVFHSTAPDNMVQTFEFEGMPGHVSLDKLSFEELGDGRTLVRTRSVFQSVEDRDGMVQAGMADGVNEGFDRLEELLERMAVPA